MRSQRYRKPPYSPAHSARLYRRAVTLALEESYQCHSHCATGQRHTGYQLTANIMRLPVSGQSCHPQLTPLCRPSEARSFHHQPGTSRHASVLLPRLRRECHTIAVVAWHRYTTSRIYTCCAYVCCLWHRLIRLSFSLHLNCYTARKPPTNENASFIIT